MVNCASPVPGAADNQTIQFALELMRGDRCSRLLRWTAPDDRGFFVHHESHGHNLHAMVFHEVELAAVGGFGSPRHPSIRGMDGPVDVGVSKMPTFRPSAASASARFAAVVDFPTPPLPEAMATMCLTFKAGSASGP